MTGHLFRRMESCFRTELGFPGSSGARQEEGAGHPLASAASAGQSRSPGVLSPGSVKDNPGLSPSVSPLRCRCPPPPRLQFGALLEAPAFCPSPLPERGDRAWAGEAPKGLFPPGRHTRARQAPRVEPSGRSRRPSQRENQKRESRGSGGAGRRGSWELRVRWGRTGRGPAD